MQGSHAGRLVLWSDVAHRSQGPQVICTNVNGRFAILFDRLASRFGLFSHHFHLWSRLAAAFTFRLRHESFLLRHGTLSHFWSSCACLCNHVVFLIDQIGALFSELFGSTERLGAQTAL